MTLFLDTDKIECRGLEHCELIKNELLNSLQNEWNKLEGIKLCVWKMLNRLVPNLPPLLIDGCRLWTCVHLSFRSLLLPENANVV